MGMADVVPGVSGGTIAFISGIYEELLDSIRSVNATALKLLLKLRLGEFWRHVNGSFLLPVLLCVLSGCAQEPAAVPTAAVTGVPASLVPSEPTDTPPERGFTAEAPALPYLRVTHYVNGETVSGYIALTDEEAAQAARETADVDVADLIEVCLKNDGSARRNCVPAFWKLRSRLWARCSRFWNERHRNWSAIFSRQVR